MTKLYRLDASARAVGDAFGARMGEDPWAGGHVAPDTFAPVITASRDFVAGPRPTDRRLQPRAVPRLWGVMPPPSADPASRRVTSVRNLDSPYWIGHLRNCEFRCLIPATAFMLWGQGTDYEGRRLKHWLGLEDQPIFALLGLWKDEDVPAFSLLSLETQGLAKTLGAKAMPIAVAAGGRAQDVWLHADWDRARRLIEHPGGQALFEIEHA
ncbi:MAG: SOS response-associated peptidase family protein [Pseudomonadota bacterium]